MSLGTLFDLENKNVKLKNLERYINEPDFWSDPKRAGKISAEIKYIKDEIEDINLIESSLDNIDELIEIIQMEDESEGIKLVDEIKNDLKDISKRIADISVKTLLSDEYDTCGAVMKLNAGAGGTEACDWCDMLFRMYKRWCESNGYRVEVLDYLDGEDAGIKSITFEVSGEFAYGYLKSEHGVHRLVRISPFNAAGKRQTSFVSCDVMPSIDDDIQIEISDDDLRIDTYRASGAGGQHINKTSSAIRITHIPTGIVVQCQNERSQIRNREKAMQMLKAKLYMKEKEEREAKEAQIRGEVSDIGWGSQIRSYILQPYSLVKDHRTGAEIGNTQAVLDGDLDLFMNEYLKSTAKNGGKK